MFEGKVVNITDRWSMLRKAVDRLGERFGRTPNFDDKYEERYGFAVTFEITRLWRGPGKRRVVILTGRGGGDCGYKFERGKTYLVYGYCSATTSCSTNICTRTSLSTHAVEDLRYLQSQSLLPVSK